MISLDRHRIYITCERCNFPARPFLRQIRHGETIVCGGCKANIHLVDHLGSFRKAQRRINRAMEDLMKSLGNLNLTLKL